MPHENDINRTEMLSFVKTASYTVNEHDAGVEIAFDSASALTCSLPSTGSVGNGFTVLVRNDGTGMLTIDPDGTDTIDGQSSVSLDQSEWRWLRSDGGDWKSIAENGGSNTDELVKISANDTTAGYLEDKLLAGTGLLASTQNEGANETRTLAVDVGTSANDIVQLDGSGKLPAVDGSQLTGIGRGSGNLLINGDFRVSQRGTAFDSTTTPANNDDTYLADRWILLSDGNDVVDVNVKEDGGLGNYSYIEADVETIQKKFGFLQIIEQKDIVNLLGEDQTVSLSFKAKVSDATKLDNIKAVVLSWTGTADSVTSDVVSTWNAADTTPTWATNWTAENTPANLNVTTTEAAYSITGISVDTSGIKNIGVFIWSDAVADNDTLGTTLQFTDVQLEIGASATNFERQQIQTALAQCLRYYERFTSTGSSEIINQGWILPSSNTQSRSIYLWKVTKRAAPSVAVSAGTDFRVNNNTSSTATTSISVSGTVQHIQFSMSHSAFGSTNDPIWLTSNVVGAWYEGDAEL